jgi:hypothetical protein
MIGIGLASSLLISVLLFLVLLLLWRKASASARELPAHEEIEPTEEAGLREACPVEMVSRIFSTEDREFVCTLQSPIIEKLFRAERKSLALLWVQQTTQWVQRIMREHTELARRSADLEFRTEMKILLRYAELWMVCSFLRLSIELAGPFWLRGLAVYASNVSQRLDQSHEAFLAATEPRDIGSVSSY